MQAAAFEASRELKPDSQQLGEFSSSIALQKFTSFRLCCCRQTPTRNGYPIDWSFAASCMSRAAAAAHPRLLTCKSHTVLRQFS